jgi:hypothetical protein
VRRHGRVVVVDATLHDTGGPGAAVGVSQATAYASLAGSSWGPTAAMHQIDGDSWRGSLRFPPGTRPGVWTVGVALADGVGLYPGYFSESPLAPAVRKVRVEAQEDKRAPIATAVSLSPRPVDVRRSARRVRVAVEARDALSGVTAVQLSLTRDDASVFAIHQAELHLVTGSAHAGRWRGQVDLPRFSRRGLWVVDVSLVDRTGHSRTYRSNFAGTVPNPPGLRSLRVISHRDRMPPEVGSVTASASGIDLRSAARTVTIQARIRDAGSGVASASAAILRGVISEFQVPLHLVSGTRADGLWRGTWTATTCQVEAGTRTVRVRVRDRASNQGLPDVSSPTVAVINDDHLGPWIPTSELTGTSALMTFSEDVFGISPASALLRDPAADPGTPPVSGSWQCVDDAGAPVACEAGPVRTARFLPDAPFPAHYLRLVINPEHVLDVTDAAGNPYLAASYFVGLPPK